MTWVIALKLGRVSNLPTVWTNVLAGLLLAGGTFSDPKTLPMLISMSLFYVGGMYLNDAFDADIDALERPERPIPSGQICRRNVYKLGFSMLAAGVAMLAWIGLGFYHGTGVWPALAGIILSSAIVLYDWYHKSNPLSPLIMGLCRVMVYITAGSCFVIPLPAPLLIGATLLLCYLIGLTYIAKQETLGRVENLWPLIFLVIPVIYGAGLILDHSVTALFWIAFTGWAGISLWFVKRRQLGDIPHGVVSLIAGIALFDAMLISGTGETGYACLAVAGFLLTVALQRLIPGT